MMHSEFIITEAFVHRFITTSCFRPSHAQSFATDVILIRPFFEFSEPSWKVI